MKQLLEISEKGLIDAYNQLVNVAGALEADARAYGYFANPNGTGEFARIAANALVAYIESAITGQRLDVVNSLGLPELSNTYSEWKASLGYSPNHWELTGTTAASFIARYESGGFVFMVNPAAVIPRISFSGKQRGSIDATTLVNWLENGTVNQKARPLVSGSTFRFLGSNYQRMMAACNAALCDWIAANHKSTGSNPPKRARKKQTLSQIVAANINLEFANKPVLNALAKAKLRGPDIGNSKKAINLLLDKSGTLPNEKKQVIKKVSIK